jgi:charged multivesicular body protein 1
LKRISTHISQAMKQGHGDIARIYAQNAVRKQNEKLNLLQLSSRVDAVAGRVQTAVTMRQITGNMMKVNRSLDVAMKSMSPERVCHVSGSVWSCGKLLISQ